MPTLGELVKILEGYFPTDWQEKWDNSGLLTGDLLQPIEKIIVTVDITESVVREAVTWGASLIVAHHPLVFRPLKRLVEYSWVERTLLLAIRENIALYCAHTNVDVAPEGLNAYIGRQMGLQHMEVLRPHRRFWKVITYAPPSAVDSVRRAMWNAGGGRLPGKAYDRVSFLASGQGTHALVEATSPSTTEEVRIESVVDDAFLQDVLAAVRAEHPYQEPVIDIFEINSLTSGRGLGIVGNLSNPLKYPAFLKWVKEIFDTPTLQYTPPIAKHIQRVAFVGGSGASLLEDAVRAKADVFITADVKYHQFFESIGRIALISLNHYDSEKAVMDLLLKIIQRKFPNIAARKTHVDTNPIAYF